MNTKEKKELLKNVKMIGYSKKNNTFVRNIFTITKDNYVLFTNKEYEHLNDIIITAIDGKPIENERDRYYKLFRKKYNKIATPVTCVGFLKHEDCINILRFFKFIEKQLNGEWSVLEKGLNQHFAIDFNFKTQKRYSYSSMFHSGIFNLKSFMYSEKFQEIIGQEELDNWFKEYLG